jgi:hypothetical protein
LLHNKPTVTFAYTTCIKRNLACRTCQMLRRLPSQSLHLIVGGIPPIAKTPHDNAFDSDRVVAPYPIYCTSSPRMRDNLSPCILSSNPAAWQSLIFFVQNPLRSSRLSYHSLVRLPCRKLSRGHNIRVQIGGHVSQCQYISKFHSTRSYRNRNPDRFYVLEPNVVV